MKREVAHVLRYRPAVAKRQPESLAEFHRVSRPGGGRPLSERVRSERWPSGVLMDPPDPLRLRLDRIGCHWNRRIVDESRNAGFDILAIREETIVSPAAPALLPGRLIKGRKSQHAGH